MSNPFSEAWDALVAGAKEEDLYTLPDGSRSETPVTQGQQLQRAKKLNTGYGYLSNEGEGYKVKFTQQNPLSPSDDLYRSTIGKASIGGENVLLPDSPGLFPRKLRDVPYGTSALDKVRRAMELDPSTRVGLERAYQEGSTKPKPYSMQAVLGPKGNVQSTIQMSDTSLANEGATLLHEMGHIKDVESSPIMRRELQSRLEASKSGGLRKKFWQGLDNTRKYRKMLLYPGIAGAAAYKINKDNDLSTAQQIGVGGASAAGSLLPSATLGTLRKEIAADHHAAKAAKKLNLPKYRRALKGGFLKGYLPYYGAWALGGALLGTTEANEVKRKQALE